VTRAALVAAAVACLLALAAPGAQAATEQPAAPGADAPLLAYYYIWYTPSSWNRAKTDYPLLGRYSSDEETTMAQHIDWAKQAGIEGFIVSWKDTPVLNSRLAALVRLAQRKDFKLAVIYQGLDFERRPQPITRVSLDFDYFADRYGRNPVFTWDGKPLMIWSGTWEFTDEEIASVTGAHRDRLQVLATERNLQEYEEVADSFDGNAYYWSSVNPDTFPGYPEKLNEMGAAAHARGGKWIAPAAPGFDARMLGGKTVVDRKEGGTLRRQMAVARGSDPDAVGLISWNEFSENSHVEPSEKYDGRYLGVIADIQGREAPDVRKPDAQAAAPDRGRRGSPLSALLGLVGLVVMVAVLSRRRKRVMAG
jgi:hypothetical protein